MSSKSFRWHLNNVIEHLFHKVSAPFWSLQVYNALGFSYFRDNKLDEAINLFEKAVKLRPGYVIAWYNLGNVYEVKKDFKNALKAYEESLLFDPNNKIAQRRRDAIKERVDRFRNIPDKD